MLRGPRWAVLISGRGSNLGALLDLRDEIDIACVYSSSARAYGLLRARRAGVPTAVLVKTGQGPIAKMIDWVALDRDLRRRGVSRLVLAGFMRIVPSSFIDLWEKRILNLHPSLLPAYPGVKSIERAYQAGDDVGVSIHEVDRGVDTGPVILRRRSLNQPAKRGYSLERSELLVHIDEQRLIKEACLKWNP